MDTQLTPHFVSTSPHRRCWPLHRRCPRRRRSSSSRSATCSSRATRAWAASLHDSRATRRADDGAGTSRSRLTPSTELGTILSVWAHPDDETYLAGGVMAAARDNGQRVVCVSATAGEHGTPDPDDVATRAPGSAAALGGGRSDGGARRRRSPFPRPSRRRARPSRDRGRALVGQLIDDVRPDTILTFGADGITFHPDHIAVHRWVTAAWELRGRPGRLLYATSTTDHLARFGALYDQWGIYMTDERPTGARSPTNSPCTSPSMVRASTASSPPWQRWPRRPVPRCRRSTRRSMPRPSPRSPSSTLLRASTGEGAAQTLSTLGVRSQ